MSAAAFAGLFLPDWQKGKETHTQPIATKKLHARVKGWRGGNHKFSVPSACRRRRRRRPLTPVFGQTGRKKSLSTAPESDRPTDRPRIVTYCNGKRGNKTGKGEIPSPSAQKCNRNKMTFGKKGGKETNFPYSHDSLAQYIR